MQLVEVYIPKDRYDAVEQVLKDFSSRGAWKENELETRYLIRMIVADDDVEEVLDYLEAISTLTEGFETILSPVHTYFSRKTIEKERSKHDGDSEQGSDQNSSKKLLRASRQELTHIMEQKGMLNMNYTLLIIFSAIVATAGFMKDSEAVVIGAMAIAPLIGPAISIGFATVLGDGKRLYRAGLSLFVGFIIVTVIAITFGFFFEEILDTRQYLMRTEVTLADFMLALASGAAGALSIINRVSSGLIGVMVAVALLPPCVTFGMSIGQARWADTYGALLLITTNVSCILLSAVVIFILTGIRPVKWKKEVTVNVSRILSIIFISLLFITLLVVTVLELTR
ncbi:TIGR00341 family protein [Halalkalibacillus halophilus]|uniref:TIGR00341 family protein n=1 Tax=Halalkalibacillus halophilus TaxID=392827 RepID=UPI00040CB266|nr:TIGR00341 family protein [Halalkalibacillus halophilus]